MARQEPASFDLKTVALMRDALDDAWACLPLQQRVNTSRTLLAEPILKEAAKGVRDRQRLIQAALKALAA